MYSLYTHYLSHGSTKKKLKKNRLAEVVQFLCAYPPFEGFADTGTEQSEFDVVLLVDHCVLAMCEPAVSHCRREGHSPGSC